MLPPSARGTGCGAPAPRAPQLPPHLKSPSAASAGLISSMCLHGCGRASALSPPGRSQRCRTRPLYRRLLRRSPPLIQCLRLRWSGLRALDHVAAQSVGQRPWPTLHARIGWTLPTCPTPPSLVMCSRTQCRRPCQRLLRTICRSMQPRLTHATSAGRGAAWERGNDGIKFKLRHILLHPHRPRPHRRRVHAAATRHASAWRRPFGWDQRGVSSAPRALAAGECCTIHRAFATCRLLGRFSAAARPLSVDAVASHQSRVSASEV